VKVRWFLLLLACWAGCPKKAPLEVLGGVRVAQMGGEAQLETAKLERVAAEAFAATTGLPQMDVTPPGATVVRLDLALEPNLQDGAKEKTLRLLVQTTVRWTGKNDLQPIRHVVLAERALQASDDLGAAWKAHSERAVRDAVSTVGRRIKLGRSDDKAVLDALASKDDDQTETAVRLSGERHLTHAVPLILPMLKSHNPDERDLAIGALQEIRDPRAVKPLTELARFGDLEELPKVLTALGRIGGDEAKSYLEFVAQGHESSEIRQMAKRALDHMQPLPVSH
jgi:hypothetical protein